MGRHVITSYSIHYTKLYDEDIAGLDCAYGFDSNRSLIVPGEECTLDMVCYESCDPCESSSIGDTVLGQIRVTPNPAKGLILNER